MNTAWRKLSKMTAIVVLVATTAAWFVSTHWCLSVAHSGSSLAVDFVLSNGRLSFLVDKWSVGQHGWFFQFYELNRVYFLSGNSPLAPIPISGPPWECSVRLWPEINIGLPTWLPMVISMVVYLVLQGLSRLPGKIAAFPIEGSPPTPTG